MGLSFDQYPGFGKSWVRYYAQGAVPREVVGVTAGAGRPQLKLVRPGVGDQVGDEVELVDQAVRAEAK